MEEGAAGVVMRSHMVYSDDHGQSWKVGQGTRLGNSFDPARTRFSGAWIPPVGGTAAWQGSECEAAEAEGGNLYLTVREEAAHEQGRAFSRSRDGGVTWDPLERQVGLPVSDCQASLLRWIDPSQPQSGLFLWAGIALDAIAGRSVERQKLTLYISRDFGRNWREASLLHRGPAAYSDLSLLGDGSFLCFYEGGERGPYETIHVAHFDSTWLGIRTNAESGGHP